MPLRVRLVKSGLRQAFYNMGLDEAFFESAVSGGLPVLRFYGWDPPAVSIGYFQRLHEVVDVEACREAGVDLVRRASGGGAVFHQAEITYSIVIPAGEEPPPDFDSICGAVMEGLAVLGIPSRFKPVNDIYACGGKISGNARLSRGACLLQHGTVLLGTNPDLMSRLLKIPGGKDVFLAGNRVTGAAGVLGRPVSFGEAEAALVEGFRRRLSLDFIPEEDLPEEERALILAREFASEERLFLR